MGRIILHFERVSFESLGSIGNRKIGIEGTFRCTFDKFNGSGVLKVVLKIALDCRLNFDREGFLSIAFVCNCT